MAFGIYDDYTPNQLPERKRSTVSFKLDMYPEDVRDKVRNLIWNANYQAVIDAAMQSPSVIPSPFDAMLPDSIFKVTERRLSKAVSAHMYRNFKVKLGDDDLQYIGTLAADSTAFDVDFDMTNRFDWDAGDYGDRGSCFIGGCYNEARVNYLPRLGASALRFYGATGNRDTGDNGRCWIIPVPHYYTGGAAWYIATNFYGLCSATVKVRTVMRQVLAETIGGAWIDRKVEVQGSGIYYNGGSKFLFVPDTVETAKLPTAFTIASREAERSTFSIPTWAKYDNASSGSTCTNCGCHLTDDDEHFSDGGAGPYCEDCYSDLYTWCDCCESECYRDDAHAITGTDRNGYSTMHTLCEYCYDRRVTTCDHCGEYIIVEGWRYGPVEDDHVSGMHGCTYCQSCVDRGYIMQCARCEEYTDDDLNYVNAANGDEVGLCDYCKRNATCECDACGSVLLTEDVTDGEAYPVQECDGTCYCEDCWEINKPDDTDDTDDNPMHVHTHTCPDTGRVLTHAHVHAHIDDATATDHADTDAIIADIIGNLATKPTDDLPDDWVILNRELDRVALEIGTLADTLGVTLDRREIA